MPQAETVFLSCAADDLFAMPTTVMLRSVLANLSRDWQLNILVLDGGLSSTSKSKMLRSLSDFEYLIEFVKPNQQAISKLYWAAKSRYPPSAYLRLLLPEIMPEDCNKVIYLDGDLIVLKSLHDLWQKELGEFHMLAAMDAANRTLGYPRHLKHLNFEKLGVSPTEKYLQSGVIVINLEAWRRDNTTKNLLNFIELHPELPYPDQDALNLVLAGRWLEIDPRWNQIFIVFRFARWQDSPYDQTGFSNVKNDPFIIHYGAKPKPWEANCTHPMRSMWNEYLDQTEWRSWRTSIWQRKLHFLRRSARRVRKEVFS